MTGKLTHVAEYEIKFNDPFVGHRYGEADAEEKKITLQVPTDVDQILNQNITWDSLRSMGFQIARKGRRDNNTKNNECRAVAIQAITEAMRSEGVGQRDTRGNIEFEATEGVSVLELCYRIAEIATEKYNYNPRGDDFLFIMAMCEFSLRELQPQVQVGQGPREPVQFVRELPGIVDVNMDVPLEFVEAELELGLAEAERQGAGMQDLLQGFRDAGVNEAEARRFLEEQGVNLPEGQAVRMNPNPFTSIANRIAKSYNQKKLTKRMSKEADRRVIQALKDSLSPEAAAFLKAEGVANISLRTGTVQAGIFDSACEGLINAYQVGIENGCEAIRENINGVVVEEGYLIKFNTDKLEPILESIDATHKSISDAGRHFITSMEHLRDYGAVLRGVAGTIPGLPEAIDRALFLDARNSELIVDPIDSRAAMQAALDAISAEAKDINSETVRTLYSGVIAHIGLLNEMYEALELLLESRGSEDRRAEYHLEGALKYLIGALEADLRAIDPEGNAALIERLDEMGAVPGMGGLFIDLKALGM